MRVDFKSNTVFCHHSGDGMISYFTSFEEAQEFYETCKEPKTFHDFRNVEVTLGEKRYLAAIEYLIKQAK